MFCDEPRLGQKKTLQFVFPVITVALPTTIYIKLKTGIFAPVNLSKARTSTFQHNTESATEVTYCVTAN